MRVAAAVLVGARVRRTCVQVLLAGVFITVHVLLTPTSGYVGQTETEVAIDVLLVFLVVCAVSVAVWAYFRYRPERWKAHAAR